MNLPIHERYPYILHFTKFVDMWGAKIEDKLGFCSEADAERWVKGVNANYKKGTVGYKVLPGYFIEGHINI